MSNITVNIKRLDRPPSSFPNTPIPPMLAWIYRSNEDCVLKPLERRLVSTGLAIALPDVCCASSSPRSGLAIKQGLSIVNTPGLIDAHYRGGLKVILINLDPTNSIQINKGDRIAQLVIQEVPTVNLIEVDELDGNRPRRRRLRLQRRSLVIYVILSADRLRPPIYHPILKHSASLRNCAWDDI